MYGQQTFRKRPLFHAPSLSSDSGSTEKRSIGRTSIASRRSGALSRKSVGSEIVEGLHPDSKWLKPREYLLLVIEAALSLTAYVIRERNFKVEELERVKLTSHQAAVYITYVEGYSSLVSTIIGVLADSYFRHYTVAMFTVILHFAAVCLVFMEDTIRGNQKRNPYAQLVWNVCTYSLVLAKASDFTRLVYGLEGMSNRRRSTIFIFVFLMFWVSSYGTYGGIILTIFHAFFRYINIRLSIVAFLLTGISLYLFVYVLYPETPRKENSGLGCRVVGCLFLAVYYKICRVKKAKKKRGFFGSTEGKYEKTTISRTKDILLLYCLLLPTLGLIIYTMLKANLYLTTIWTRVKSDNVTKAVGLNQLARAITAIAMVMSYFGLWPLLGAIGSNKNKAVLKFLLGHLLSVIVLFYSAGLMRSVETPQFSSGSGFVRIFNTRTEPVHFKPEDRDFTTHEFLVDPKKGLLLAYPCSKETLFAMRVMFIGTTTNFTLFLSVAPDETTGYMVLDPPEIARIRGPYLPLREGPPGTNIGSWPRIFFYNTAETLDGVKVNIKHPHHKEVEREVLIEAGIMKTIAVEPAAYDFSIALADIETVVDVQEGGVYGVLIHATSSSREMEIDAVVAPNSASPWSLFGLYFLEGLASGIGYPTMRAIIFFIAPHGLKAMAFAYLAFLEGISLWIGYIGFRTWHYYVTSTVVFVYAFGVTMFLFLCMFVLLKFKDSYS